MDATCKEEELEQEKRNVQQLHSVADWDLAASSMEIIGSSSCSSAPIMDPSHWDHPQNLAFAQIQNASLRPGGMGWISPTSMFKGTLFPPTAPSALLPHTLTHFPPDSGFIERAARFSCFGVGNFADMINPFSSSTSSTMPDSINLNSRGPEPPQAQAQGQGPSPANGLKSMSTMQSPKNVIESPQGASLLVDHGNAEGSPLDKENNIDNIVRSHDVAKQSISLSGNESADAEFSADCQEELEAAGRESAKKRKRSRQDAELDQNKAAQQQLADAIKDRNECQQKAEENQTSTTGKAGGKSSKQGSQASDQLAKGEYIHVRARRGQATNSHSLAERLRREKISERMKFLQDLVPGCSKVTGKAVMLDEIINYVQSLQRQVEFLSMKLATVNPQLDFNMEGLLAKDMFQSRAGPSSSLAFPPEMTMPYPPLHRMQPGLVQASIPGIGISSDVLRRSINCQLPSGNGGYKDPVAQVPGAWEDELHNIVQMGLNSSAPLDSQDLSGCPPQGHMKAEP